MFDTVRNVRLKTAAASAGIVIIATILGAGVSAADTKGKLTEVSLQNTLPVTVEVTFSGDEALKKISPYQSGGNGPARVVGKVPDGITIKWEAKPKNDQDKNQFTGCKGEKKVSGSTATIVVSTDSCGKSSANAASKTGAGNTQANDKTDKDKTDKDKTEKDKTSNDKKANEKKADDKAANNKTSNDKTANNKKDNDKTSGNSADSAGGTMQVTLENTLDNDAVRLRIWDLVDGGASYLEIDSIGAATFNGKPSGVKNTSNFNAKKDKSGKYSIEVEWHCGDRGGVAKYKDSVNKIQIVKSGDGCELKNVKKL